MSLILDALKKAQEERKRIKPRFEGGGIQGVYTKNKKAFYIILSASAGVILLASVLPIMLKAKPAQTPSKTIVLKEQPDTVSKPVAKIETAKKTEEKTEAFAKTVSKTKTEDEILMSKPQKVKAHFTETVREEKAEREPKEIAALKKKAARANKPYAYSSATPVNPREEMSSALMENTKVVVMRVDEEKIMTMYNEALLETEKGRTNEAKKLYLKILSEKPDNIEVLNNLGVIAMREGNVNEALIYFRKILEKKPGYTKAYNNIGILLMREGDKKLAEEYFKKAIDMDKDGAEAYINFSGLLRAQRRYDEASRALENLIRRGNKDPSAYLSLALIKDDMGEVQEAIKYYRFYLREGGKREEKNKVIERLKVLEESQFTRNR
ncbi:MAG: tetratricopeptide repeat protein [Proteobacteria bacterium]|nr:tetratricopeptide repeat protein [Pseudomonadota bacterium]